MNDKLKRIKIRFFGQIAEIIGKQEDDCVLPEGQPAGSIREYLTSLYPALLELSWKVAVDQILIQEFVELKDGSEIAILPPYAGG